MERVTIATSATTATATATTIGSETLTRVDLIAYRLNRCRSSQARLTSSLCSIGIVGAVRCRYAPVSGHGGSSLIKLN